MVDLVEIDGCMNKDKYKKILQRHIVPLMKKSPNLIYMHDNAKPHAADIVSNYLAKQPFEVIQWPSLSCDCNPIENIWGIMIQDWPTITETNARLKAARLSEIVHERWNDLRARPGFYNFFPLQYTEKG